MSLSNLSFRDFRTTFHSAKEKRVRACLCGIFLKGCFLKKNDRIKNYLHEEEKKGTVFVKIIMEVKAARK